MRLLIIDLHYAGTVTWIEIDSYLKIAHRLFINVQSWSLPAQQLAARRYKNNLNVSFISFDPLAVDDLQRIVIDEPHTFDAIICPPYVTGLTREIFQTILAANDSRHQFRAIAIPNDSISHLADIEEWANEHNIAIIHTPGIHAQSVAEYTLTQIGFHARRLAHFYDITGRDNLWPHNEASSSTHLLRGKTLGVIGGSGKDGSATIDLSIKFGLKVVTINSGSLAGLRKVRSLGASVADSLDTLLASSDFISINCRPTANTIGLIGSKQIDLMKREVIVINPSAAEIINKVAIFREFNKPTDERHIGTLVMDMPFGGKRDSQAFATDPDNSVLKRLGVVFTPRMAGYTIEARLQAATDLANYLDQYLRLHDTTVPIINHLKSRNSSSALNSDGMDKLLNDVITCAHEAGQEAIRLRESGLTIQYKADGSPYTNADVATEIIIRDNLRSLGYVFKCSGEELHEDEFTHSSDIFEIVIDGIDGTRNFRDGNFGWCVSIAVIMNGVTIIGVVYDPHCDETYFAVKKRGAFIVIGEHIKICSVPSTLPDDFSFSVGSFRVRGSVTTKRHIIEDIKVLGGRGREWGSVALSICAVARGGLGTFIQGNSHSHDHAAGLLIAEEAGANIEMFAKSDFEVADIVVSHPLICDRVNQIFKKRTTPTPDSQI